MRARDKTERGLDFEPPRAALASKDWKGVAF
jgi:hypothetical protein